MSRWWIDPHRTAFRVTFNLPGLAVNIRGVTGTFLADLDERGQPDLSQPVEGDFAMTVDDLQLGNALLTKVVKRWLGDDDHVAISGWMGDVEPVGDDQYRYHLRLRLRGEEHGMQAIGRTALQPDGSVQVHGSSEVDPRQVGVPIPRAIPLRVRTSYDLRVVPTDAD